jgi:hypothetical protein
MGEKSASYKCDEKENPGNISLAVTRTNRLKLIKIKK